MPSVLQMCSGSTTDAGRPSAVAAQPLDEAAEAGPVVGAPGLAFSAFVGWWGTPVSIQ